MCVSMNHLYSWCIGVQGVMVYKISVLLNMIRYFFLVVTSSRQVDDDAQC